MSQDFLHAEKGAGIEMMPDYEWRRLFAGLAMQRLVEIIELGRGNEERSDHVKKTAARDACDFAEELIAELKQREAR